MVEVKQVASWNFNGQYLHYGLSITNIEGTLDYYNDGKIVGMTRGNKPKLWLGTKGKRFVSFISLSDQNPYVESKSGITKMKRFFMKGSVSKKNILPRAVFGIHADEPLTIPQTLADRIYAGNSSFRPLGEVASIPVEEVLALTGQKRDFLDGEDRNMLESAGFCNGMTCWMTLNRYK